MLTPEQQKRIREHKEHAESCNSAQCHHDLWAPPPHYFGDKDCRCRECVEGTAASERPAATNR